jgi:hypothetical protein
LGEVDRENPQRNDAVDALKHDVRPTSWLLDGAQLHRRQELGVRATRIVERLIAIAPTAIGRSIPTA